MPIYGVPAQRAGHALEVVAPDGARVSLANCVPAALGTSRRDRISDSERVAISRSFEAAPQLAGRKDTGVDLSEFARQVLVPDPR